VSDPTDIKALDEYLKGDSDVSQRYRELGCDELPPELDRRVLAAAREAVANESTKRSRSWMRWSAPVAIAASVVLVVTVVLVRGVQDQTVLPPQPAAAVQQVRSDVASDDKAENAVEAPKLQEQSTLQKVDTPKSPAPEVSAVSRPDEEALAQAEALLRGDQRQAAMQTTPVAIVPEAPAAAAPAQAPEPFAANKSVTRSEPEADASHDVSEVAVTAGRARRAPGRSVGPRNTISNSAFSAGSRPAADEQRERSDPQAWLEDIRVMRRAGKDVEADREWQRFREAFPTFQVADDDIARATDPDRK